MKIRLAFLGFVLAAPAVSGRETWKTSAFHGTPEPPPPFVAEEIWPELRFEMPVDLVAGPQGRMFVVERWGRIFAVDPAAASPEKRLVADLRAAPAFQAFDKPELYGLAFHPRFAETREVFLRARMDEQSDDGSRVYRARMSGDGTIDLATLDLVLTFRSGSHCGGNLAFGPDGFLYVTTGDARPPSPPDELNTGQDLSDLESAILRIDVDHRDPGLAYSVPTDNPFVATPGARPELWAFGLRNPWKIAFRPGTGELWCGDVGWEMWEMIHRIEKGGNYGWSITEGPQPVKPDQRQGPGPIVPPLVAHPHTEAASITGGDFYGSPRLPDLRDAYVYGDYMTGRLWAIWHDGEKIVRHDEIARTGQKPVTFGRDSRGEIYFFDFGNDRAFQRLARRPPETEARPFPRRLSESGLFSDTAAQTPAPGVFPYEILSPLESDGASAERWIALPGTAAVRTKEDRRGGHARVSAKPPAGTVFARTLSHRLAGIGERRLETQVLHFTGRDWNGYTYRWNDDQTDAVLVDADGESVALEVEDPLAPGGKRRLDWHLHSRADCARCHNAEAGFALGFHPSQLAAGDQLERFAAAGLVEADFADLARRFPMAAPADGSADLALRARSWLHANCAHCHRFQGGGSGVFRANIEVPDGENLWTLEKPLQGHFNLQDPHLVTPGEPASSVLLHRVAKAGPGHMPSLGSRFVTAEGYALLHDWILAGEQRPPLPAPPDSLDDVTLAHRALRELSDADLAPSTRQRWIGLGLNSPNPEVSALFERFRRADPARPVLGPSPDPAPILALVGDPKAGAAVFQKTNCASCHQLDGQGGVLGPPLDDLGQRLDAAQILEAILEPSKSLAPGYATLTVTLRDGTVHTGFERHRSGDHLTLLTLAGQEIRIPFAEVAGEARQTTSLMPPGLLQLVTAQEAADLIAFLQSRG